MIGSVQITHHLTSASLLNKIPLPPSTIDTGTPHLDEAPPLIVTNAVASLTPPTSPTVPGTSLTTCQKHLRTPIPSRRRASLPSLHKAAVPHRPLPARVPTHDVSTPNANYPQSEDSHTYSRPYHHPSSSNDISIPPLHTKYHVFTTHDEDDMPPGYPYETCSDVVCFVWEYLKGMQGLATGWMEQRWEIRTTT